MKEYIIGDNMKTILAILISLVMATGAFAGSDSMGWKGPIDGSIDGATAYHTFDLSTFKTVGFFSLHVVTTGAGTCTITYELSNMASPVKGSTDYVAPGVTAIVTAKAAGSGFYQFPVSGEAMFGKHLEIKIVATGAVVYTLYPNVQ